MNPIRWLKRRTARTPLTTSRDVAAELARARRDNQRVADHRPLRGGDLSFDPRHGVPPTP